MQIKVRAALAGNESDETSVPTSQPPLHSDVVAEITNSIAGLCIPTKTKNVSRVIHPHHHLVA